jgi:hypothetical protein
MKTNKNDMIQVALPATGIMAFIDAPYDWPTPGVVLQLGTLVTRSGGAAFQDDVLEKVVVSSASMILEQSSRDVDFLHVCLKQEEGPDFNGVEAPCTYFSVDLATRQPEAGLLLVRSNMATPEKV